MYVQCTSRTCIAMQLKKKLQIANPDLMQVKLWIIRDMYEYVFEKKALFPYNVLNKNKINPKRHDHEEQQKFKNHIENLKYRN